MRYLSTVAAYLAPLGGGEPYAFFFFSSRRRHTRLQGDWSSDVCSSDLIPPREQEPFWQLKKPFGDLSKRGARRTLLVREKARCGKCRSACYRAPVYCAEIGRASCRERV